MQLQQALESMQTKQMGAIQCWVDWVGEKAGQYMGFADAFGLKFHTGIKAPGLLFFDDVNILQQRALALPIWGKVIEVGSFMGLSAIAMAQKTFAQIYCVDPFLNIFENMNVEFPRIHKTFLKNTIEHSNIHCIHLYSLDAVDIFSDGFADIIFIDGDHRYEQALSDLEGWWPKVKTGGIMLVHDVDDAKEVGEAVKKFIFENKTEAKFYKTGPGMAELRKL